jgi:hypothetical protein
MPAYGANPYARPVSPGDGSAPDPSGEFRWGGPGRYAVPDIPESTDPDYQLGGAQELAASGSPDGTKLPDDIRIGTREPPPNDPNRTDVNQRRYSDFYRRTAVEQYTLNWDVQQYKVPGGQNPLWTQEREPIRPTATKAPAGYQFTRPWHIPRNIKDAVGEEAVTHISLADHRRNYEIFGQRPQGGIGTNTYRVQPRPWDDQLFVPPQAQNEVNDVFGHRGFRAGG